MSCVSLCKLCGCLLLSEERESTRKCQSPIYFVFKRMGVWLHGIGAAHRPFCRRFGRPFCRRFGCRNATKELVHHFAIQSKECECLSVVSFSIPTATPTFKVTFFWQHITNTTPTPDPQILKREVAKEEKSRLTYEAPKLGLGIRQPILRQRATIY